MDLKIFGLLALLVGILSLTGCATSRESSEDYSPALEPAASRDDSHGWGASIGSVNK